MKKLKDKSIRQAIDELEKKKSKLLFDMKTFKKELRQCDDRIGQLQELIQPLQERINDIDNQIIELGKASGLTPTNFN